MIYSFDLAADIEQLNRFPCGGYSDECSIVFLTHPCIILSALEVETFPHRMSSNL